MKFVIAFMMILSVMVWGQESADPNMDLGLNSTKVTEGQYAADLESTNMRATGVTPVKFCENCQKEMLLFESADDGEKTVTTGEVPAQDSNTKGSRR